MSSQRIDCRIVFSTLSLLPFHVSLVDLSRALFLQPDPRRRSLNQPPASSLTVKSTTGQEPSLAQLFSIISFRANPWLSRVAIWSDCG